MPLKKLCSWHGCNKVLDDGVIYCEKHQKKWEDKEKERYKEYKERRIKDKNQKRYQDFYNSPLWRTLSKAIRSEYYHIDILEYYRTGNIIQGEAVHHIVEIEDDWESRYDSSNLIYLTEKNHRRVHEQYNKSSKDKKVMQKILFDLIDRFNKEFI